MAKQPFIIKGIPAIEKAIRELEPKIAKKVIRKNIRKGLKPIKAEVEAQAPVESGATKASVKIRAMKGKRGRIGVNVQIGAGDFKGETFYAAFREYGTSKMEADPFMRRAFDNKAESAKAETERGIVADIEAEVKKAKVSPS